MSLRAKRWRNELCDLASKTTAISIMTRPAGFFEGTEMPTAGWWEALFSDPAGIVTALGARPGMVVIDLCSGDGWFTLPIARLARHVFAVDIEPGLIDVSRSRLTEAGLGNVTYIEGNAYDVSRLVPSPVDLVFMANCFHGVPDGARLAREVGSVLTPNGRFAVLNWHATPRQETPVLGEPRGPRTDLRLSPSRTIALVEEGGLERAGIVEVPPYHYGAVFRLPNQASGPQ